MQVRSVSYATINIKDVVSSNQVEVRRLSEQVLQSFSTWAFKRQQPTEPAVLLRFIEWSVARSLPIQFVLYWGKGPRSAVAEPDCVCLRFLSQMGERIRAAYSPGASFTLIATDTHAEHNGHSSVEIARYFSELTSAASEYDYSLRYLSAIVDSQRDRISTCVSPPTAKVLDKLEPCAEKWYRGEGASAEGAAKYFQMNMIEKQAVELAFPDAIFITFNNADFRELFPEKLPAFYMYSMRKGSSVKPWFLDGELASAPQSGKIKATDVAGLI